MVRDVVSVLKVECLGLVSWVWRNRTSRSWGFSVSVSSRSRRYNISASGFVTLDHVNIHAMHHACGYIRKKIMDLTHKKQVVKWQTSPVSVFKLRNCGLNSRHFLEHHGLEGWTSRLVLEGSMSRSHLSWEFEKMERLGLEGWPSRSRLSLVT